VRQQQEEQRRVFADQLPNQATTFYQRAQADAAMMPRDRYSLAQVTTATVVGSNPTIDYPAGPAWSADPGALCIEPPLGFDNPALEPSSSCSAQATGPTSDDPSPLGRAVGPLSSDDPATEGLAPPSVTLRAQRGGVGSSPFRRRI
jgi:hypothetical protein